MPDVSMFLHSIHMSLPNRTMCRSMAQVHSGLAKHTFLLHLFLFLCGTLIHSPSGKCVRWMGVAINPQKDTGLAPATCTVMILLASLPLISQFLYQLRHVFHPVGATLPVLIITYKTVTVNFMASILSLQGCGAAHKLS